MSKNRLSLYRLGILRAIDEISDRSLTGAAHLFEIRVKICGVSLGPTLSILTKQGYLEKVNTPRSGLYHLTEKGKKVIE